MNTKYYKTWDEYKAEHPEIVEKLNEKQEKAIAYKMQSYEDMMFGFIMFLLM